MRNVPPPPPPHFSPTYSLPWLLNKPPQNPNDAVRGVSLLLQMYLCSGVTQCRWRSGARRFEGCLKRRETLTGRHSPTASTH